MNTGSVLASEDHKTLEPIRYGRFFFRVLRAPTMQSYVAGYTRQDNPTGFSPLVSHPNGHSCKNLIERIVGGKQPMEQFDYILRCGGMGISRESFQNLLDKSFN